MRAVPPHGCRAVMTPNYRVYKVPWRDTLAGLVGTAGGVLLGGDG